MKVNRRLIKEIENSVSDIDLFSYIFNVTPEEILFSINNNTNINNPYRYDTRPSLGFKSYDYNGKVKIRCKDFGDSSYNGDPIDIVAKTMHLNAKIPGDFYKICDTILNKYIPNINKSTAKPIVKIKDLTIIEISPREWNNADWSYYKHYNIPLEYWESKQVTPIENVYVDGKIVYRYKGSDPCYAYTTGLYNHVVLYKLYYPLRKKMRFITNNIFPFECIDELVSCKNLVLIKSRKDAIAIKYILDKSTLVSYWGNLDIIPISISSEAILLTQDHVDYLSMFASNIYGFMDFDRQGIEWMQYHHKHFGIKPICLTNGRFGTIDYGAKDATDYIKLKDIKHFNKLMYEKTSHCH